MEFKTNLIEYKKEFDELIRLFFPIFKENQLHEFSHELIDNKNIIKIDDKEYEFIYNGNLDKKDLKNGAKLAIYDAMCKHFNKSFDWGDITGVRPTKIAYDLLEKGTPEYLLKETLMKDFRLHENKAKLLKEVISNQKSIIKNDKLVDIFINIPICPSRCKYCSFISSVYDKVKDIIPTYIETLLKEITYIKSLIKDKLYVVRSIYIGGGTPSVLSAEQLDTILSELTYPSVEFTVEFGRPDTITREKLDVLKKNNVTRICINPQTFSDKTLKLVGRKHTVNDVITAYKLALEYNFTINFDLIAGLPEEKLSTFKKSVNYALEMGPHNITIHSLALKRGSIMTEDAMKSQSNCEIEAKPTDDNEVKKMIDYAHLTLMERGYKPYYLYKQKNTPLGLENVGFTQKGYACLFNIDSMEDACSILACGANAISKRIWSLENHIERCANVKFIDEYISRIDEMIERKKQLFN
ncbi:MAG: coproporphyrinogen dehydrogenase HemZ [Clostridia bacterium]|nr:coproporphyrinogen dehydrogenase HemZ [Clostridia bacterium]